MRARLSSLLVLAASGLAGLSCDDDPAPAGDAGASVQSVWESYCTREAARLMACGEMPRPESCAEGGVCMANIGAPEYVVPLTECLAKRRCDESDDDCYEQTAQLGAARPPAQATVSACTAKYAECMEQRTAFICNVIGHTHESFLREVDSCLRGPCSALQSCMQALFARNGC